MPAGYSYNYKGTQGALDHAKQLNDVVTDIIHWGREKGLNDPKAQLNKVIEEVGEIAHEITRNNYDLDALEQPDELYDALGDTFVTVIILCDILNIDPLEALDTAYAAIKDRHGKTESGSFIKEEE